MGELQKPLLFSGFLWTKFGNLRCNLHSCYAFCAGVNPLSTGDGGGGGGRILPAATLEVNNIFTIKANDTKPGHFFQNLSGNNFI